MATFNKIFKKLRAERGYTLQQLADVFGMTAQGIGKWENNTQPDLDILQKLAEYFNVPVTYLISGKDDATPCSFTERCAKYDDVNMFEQRMAEEFFGNSDETGRNVFDYVIEYESVKIFKKHYLYLFDKFIGDKAFNTKDVENNKINYIDGFLRLAVRTEVLYDFEKKKNGKIPRYTQFTITEDTGAASTNSLGVEFIIYPVLKRDTFEYILNLYKNGNKTAQAVIFADDDKDYWFAALGFFAEDASVRGENKTVDKLLDYIELHNGKRLEKHRETIESLNKGRRNNHYSTEKVWKYLCVKAHGCLSADYPIGVSAFYREQFERILKYGTVRQAERAKEINKAAGLQLGISSISMLSAKTKAESKAEIAPFEAKLLAVYEYMKSAYKGSSLVDDYSLRVTQAFRDEKLADFEKVVAVLRPDGKQILWRLFPLFEDFELFTNARRKYSGEHEIDTDIYLTVYDLAKSLERYADYVEKICPNGYKPDFRFFEFAVKNSTQDIRNSALTMIVEKYSYLTEHIETLLDNNAVLIRTEHDSYGGCDYVVEDINSTALLKMIINNKKS